MEEGFVPTSEDTVDDMVEKLFYGNPPTADSLLLDCGCGDGPFIDGVLRYCKKYDHPIPQIRGIELNPARYKAATKAFASVPEVKIVNRDFLMETTEKYDYIIGNPPYVSITHISKADKMRLKKQYSTATNRFDLYMLFFEQSLSMLKKNGRLVFITPEKYLYVKSALKLRQLMAEYEIREIELIQEDAFRNRTTYPTITTIQNSGQECKTRAVRRDGAVREYELSKEDDSWIRILTDEVEIDGSGGVLADICLRISCGIATGSDKTFVRPSETIPSHLKKFAHPTISGSQLTNQGEELTTSHEMLIPYGADGVLMSEEEAEDLISFFEMEGNTEKLKARTCAKRKPFYAFHDNAPLEEINQGKIMCKDITESPQFWLDSEGLIVPRHTVYYIVPKEPKILIELYEYLRSPEVKAWLMSKCQRAANGFIRIQSSILKKLPIPSKFIE